MQTKRFHKISLLYCTNSRLITHQTRKAILACFLDVCIVVNKNESNHVPEDSNPSKFCVKENMVKSTSLFPLPTICPLQSQMNTRTGHLSLHSTSISIKWIFVIITLYPIQQRPKNPAFPVIEVLFDSYTGWKISQAVHLQRKSKKMNKNSLIFIFAGDSRITTKSFSNRCLKWCDQVSYQQQLFLK